jgi:SET domain-containing protein 6
VQLKNVDEDDMDDALVLERESGEPTPKGTFQGPATISIPPEIDDQFKKMLKAVKKVSASVVPDKRKRDDTTRAVLLETIHDHLSRYPTTLEEDLALLGGEGLDGRKRMAIAVRSGEKRLMREFIEFLSADGESVEESQSSKRARVN